MYAVLNLPYEPYKISSMLRLTFLKYLTGHIFVQRGFHLGLFH